MNKGTFGAFAGRRKITRAAAGAIWESPDTGTYTGTYIQWNHGLNFRPKLVSMGVRCLSTDGGWQAGYELDIGSLFFPGTAVTGPLTNPARYCSATVIGFQAYNVPDTLYLSAWNASANNVFSLTSGSWRPFARIFG